MNILLKMKKLKKFFTFLILFFSMQNVHASLFWKIEDGVELYKNKNYKDAYSFFEKYIQNNPNDENGYFWVAKAQINLKKDKNEVEKNRYKFYEITSYKKNIEKIFFNFDENINLEDYFDIACAYFEKGKFEEANYYADMILKINPKSSSAYFIKSKIQYKPYILH